VQFSLREMMRGAVGHGPAEAPIRAGSLSKNPERPRPIIRRAAACGAAGAAPASALPRTAFLMQHDGEIGVPLVCGRS
jgi:hypothetical protein